MGIHAGAQQCRVRPPSGGSTYYGGLDLHKRDLTLCVLDSAGQVVREQRRLAPTLEAVTAALAGLDDGVTLTLEATLQWAWFHDRLTALGYQVLVAHPQQLKLISQARCKTDPIDARKLAELTRVNLVPAIWVPDLVTRERRLRLRGRARLVRLRTRLKNRIHALLAGENLRAPGTDLFGVGGRVWLGAVPLPEPIRAEVEVTLELITALEGQIAGYDQLVRRWARALPARSCSRRCRGSGRLGPCSCSRRSGRSPGFGAVGSWPPMPGSCQVPGAPAGRRRTAGSGPRGVAGSSGS